VDSFQNKWIFAGSLGVVFLVTLGFSYGPGYGGSLLGFLGNQTGVSPEMSPSDMVTPVVTAKKMVTFENVTNVTNVTSVSPVVSPLIYSDSESTLMSPLPSRSPTVSPVSSITHSVSPSHTSTPAVSPSLTPFLQTVTPSPTPTPVSMSQSTPTPTPIIDSSQSTKININTAGLDELVDLPDIGPTRAKYIIDYRNDNGPFQKIEDIMMVKEIKTARFEKMKNLITVGP